MSIPDLVIKTNTSYVCPVVVQCTSEMVHTHPQMMTYRRTLSTGDRRVHACPFMHKRKEDQGNREYMGAATNDTSGK